MESIRQRILILGACGFSGRYFIRQIINPDIEIHAADMLGSFPSVEAKIFTHILDLTEASQLRHLLDSVSPHYIVNFAGIMQADNYSSFYNSNVAISQGILEWAAGPGREIINKVLLIGSAAEYGEPYLNPVSEDAKLEPVNFYGLSKSMQTHLALFYARCRAVPVVIARTFNLYGKGLPSSLAVGRWQRMLDAATSGDSIQVGNLESARDYISIEEAVNQYHVILLKGKVGEVYNVCSGEPVKMRAILESMILNSGKGVLIKSEPSIFKSSDVSCIYGDNTKYKTLQARAW